MLEKLEETTGLSIKENVVLKDSTTMRVGGSARYFVVVRSISELMLIYQAAIKLNLKFFILGGGSNIVVSDDGFDGLVIKNETAEMSVEGREVVVDSGIRLSILIRKLAELDMGGLEFLSGIPGTLGGAVINNAGAFGDSISSHIKSVTILDPLGEVRIVLCDDLGFDYRTSVFKRIQEPEKRGVVLRARLILRKGAREEISRKVENYLRLRASTPKGFSCGSYFKNPQVKQMKSDWESVIKNGRVPAGYLLEQAGAKGRSYGQAQVSLSHANWIINNKGKAKAVEIKQLADSLKKEVSQKFNINLEEEIEYIGF